MVKGSRQVLLAYCDSLSDMHFTAPCAGFGHGGSIRNLLVHTCTTYQAWIGKRALQLDFPYAAFHDVQNVDDARQLFTSIDQLLEAFFTRFLDMHELVNVPQGPTSALQLFTHVTTHEFHHKGQILSISRHFGYTPVDTDIMR